MTWRDDLRRVTLADGRVLIGASFRGVPFFVDSNDRRGGRRTVTHEFPGRDDPFVEDLGRRARTFAIESYVIGDSYVMQRNSLLSALEDESGPGELVHPYYGVLRAICTGVSVRESIADGGMAMFQLEMAVTELAAPAPVEAPDLADLVDVAATAAQAATEAELLASYDIEGQPGFALESLSAELTLAAEALQEALSPVATTAQEAAALAAETHIIGLQAVSLVREPTEMMAALLRSVAALSDAAVAAPRGVILALLEVYAQVGAVVDLATETTSTRTLERANQEALQAAIRRLLAIEAARLAPTVEYQTLEDARADADALAGVLEEQALIAGTDAYPALVTLRAQVRRAVPGDAVLAQLVTVERRAAIPSLLLAYQLYGAVALEADIVARSGARHPGFLSGELQVLSNG